MILDEDEVWAQARVAWDVLYAEARINRGEPTEGLTNPFIMPHEQLDGRYGIVIRSIVRAICTVISDHLSLELDQFDPQMLEAMSVMLMMKFKEKQNG
jgi:hypothetical protein